MSEQEHTPKKQGVHGWRAFFLVFGCGTLAALVIFGSVFGFARLLIGSGEQDPQSSEKTDDVVAAPTGEPQESLEPGKLDICSTTVPTISQVNVRRIDSGEDYVDTDLEGESKGGKRVVSDECEWDLVPDYDNIDPWSLSISYDAFVTPAEGEDPADVSSREFNERKDGLNTLVSSAENSGEESYSDRSYFVYGESSDDSGATTYALVAQTGNSVYQITLKGEVMSEEDELIPEAAFVHEVDKLTSRIDLDLSLWVPEEN